MWLAIAALAAPPLSALDPPAHHHQALEELAWMAGHWVPCTSAVTSEELWLPPAGGLMVGVNRQVSPGATFFEFLRIEVSAAGLVYVASPAGQKETSFAVAQIGEHLAVFENPVHDFPRRITYRRGDEDTLTAVVEGVRDGAPAKAQWSWCLADVPVDHHPPGGRHRTGREVPAVQGGKCDPEHVGSR